MSSNFNKYARRADEMAKAAFKEYGEAESRLERAQKAVREYPQRYGSMDAAYVAKSARAQADYLEAKQGLDAAKNALESRKAELQEIRNELEAELNDAYSADPAALDAPTLELLKSGILNAGEYAKLLRDAQAASNHTMVRLIGKYAADAAEARSAKYGDYDQSARALRAVAYESRRDSGSDRLEAFDYMADVYNRSVNNPAMMDKWAELTAETVERF